MLDIRASLLTSPTVCIPQPPCISDDAHGIQFDTGFPFGHGLSYADFQYSNLKVSGRTVSMTLQNSGVVAGAEVVQLYIGFPTVAGEPPQQLKGFQKVGRPLGTHPALFPRSTPFPSFPIPADPTVAIIRLFSWLSEGVDM